MTNEKEWLPSKFTFKRGKLSANNNNKMVGISSRLITDAVAYFYHINIRKYAKGKLLDLGCGKAPLYKLYSEYVDEIVCVDWGNSLHKNIHLDLHADLNKPLPIKDNEFNIIILSDVLEHIEEPKQLLTEIYRILKQEGVLLMNVPFYYPLHEQPYDYYRYTEHALLNMATTANLNVIEIKSIGGIPEILSDIISKLVSKVPLIGKGCSYIIYYFTKLFLYTKVGKKVSNATSNRFPLGYSMIAEKCEDQFKS